MMGTAFERMMCETTGALSLISTVRAATVPHFHPLDDLKPIDNDIPVRPREKATMDFRANPADVSAVIVEVEIRWEASSHQTV
jgi:hypothetical protein